MYYPKKTNKYLAFPKYLGRGFKMVENLFYENGNSRIVYGSTTNYQTLKCASIYTQLLKYRK